MRLSLIGPGKIKLHYEKLLKIKKEVLNQEITKIANAISESIDEIDILPDQGISLEIAKIFKKQINKKVIGVLPMQDKEFKTIHLEQEKNLKINNKPLFNEFIDSGTWYKHDMTKALFGNAVLYLGKSPGTEIERNSAEYLIYLSKGFKKDLNTSLKNINPNLKANKDFTILIYTPFLKDKKLTSEDEFYLNEYNINYIYIKDSNHLKKELVRLKKLY
ncbi:hypothetical protein GOV12_01335 [Candidatus Pacearchaeota archaeon]|nr:hypothetical protein [Candidatus Pacearchaeota archaeon]